MPRAFVFGRSLSTLPWVPFVFSAISISAGSTYPIQQQPGIWPPETPHVTYYTPPSGYPLATEYCYALQDINNPAPADVYLDWMQVHAIVNGQDIVVVENDYGRTGPDNCDWDLCVMYFDAHVAEVAHHRELDREVGRNLVPVLVFVR